MDYTYFVRAETAPADVERFITRATAEAPWRTNPERSAEPISVVSATPSTRDVIAQTYHFEPDVVVNVQVDKFVEDRYDRELQALDVLLAILRGYDGDVYADYYDGNPVLLRRRGVLTVYDEWLASRPWVAALLPVRAAVADLARS